MALESLVLARLSVEVQDTQKKVDFLDFAARHNESRSSNEDG